MLSQRVARRFVFNCTAQLPFSPVAVVIYVRALGIETGALARMTVRHDGKPGERCPNCGVRL